MSGQEKIELDFQALWRVYLIPILMSPDVGLTYKTLAKRRKDTSIHKLWRLCNVYHTWARVL